MKKGSSIKPDRESAVKKGGKGTASPGMKSYASKTKGGKVTPAKNMKKGFPKGC